MIVGLGVDLVEIARVEALVARHGERAVAKLFCDGEAAYARARAQPGRHLASRFAAKEAAFKALAGIDLARTIGWRDIEVLVESDGPWAYKGEFDGMPSGPWLVGRVAEEVAKIKRLPVDDVMFQLSANACRLFDLMWT